MAVPPQRHRATVARCRSISRPCWSTSRAGPRTRSGPSGHAVTVTSSARDPARDSSRDAPPAPVMRPPPASSRRAARPSGARPGGSACRRTARRRAHGR
ncbi:hypothetical protein OY671_005185 [Metschnikowia pulcherrima]|nr:hypothetical protein OY671_005185 [Metschnikowia pulcherrima]